ncbi:ferritin-like domain-containing protein [Mesorhizobium sp. M1334]|uniref:DUF892 family protein n=2 Tax=unclassified Mesorhizobium TaxID=325217 RepID=UPI0033356F05
MVGRAAALGHSMAVDEIIKNSLAFAFENYEIAAYNSLLVLTEAGGSQDPERVLRQNLSEEKAMANWLKET